MEMSNYIQTECPECDSSDAFTIYDDGAHCFSCNYSTKKVINNMDKIKEITTEFTAAQDNIQQIGELNSFAITSRGISKQVVDYFGIKMAVNPDGSGGSHYYPYTRDNKVVAYKERRLPKDFITHGDYKQLQLFGQSVATSGKIVVVTEGELDACAVAQAFMDKYNKVFPVVSIPSATGTKSLLDHRSWLRQFESVVLLFDSDDAGNAAVERAAKIIGAGKVKVGDLQGCKDPCELLTKHGSYSILQAIWNAQTWSPSGIVVGEPIWREFMDRQTTISVPYPTCLQGLNDKLQGIRHGEITLFTSGTGSGKSTVIKEIALDLLDKTNSKVGLISLEESIGDTAEKFIAMSLQRSPMDIKGIKDAELRKGFDTIFKDERLVLLDHQGSCSDTSLLDKIEYMALMGCKYLVLDHITIAVSEGSEGRSGNEAIDKLMSDLLKIVKKHDIWLGLISHLRKAQGDKKSFEEGNIASIDDIKGSGSIKQISFDIIAFARNLIADDDIKRNTIDFTVLKSRFTGHTGKAGHATYNPNTGRLSLGYTEEGFTAI